MASFKQENMDMINGSILPKIILFALPLAATGILQLLFNAADIIVVGKFAGSTCLAAVGATSSLINLLVGAFIGISVGVNIIVARHLGCRQEERVQKTIHVAFALSLLLGAIVLVLGMTLSTPLLHAMQTPTDVLPLSSLYLKIYFFGVPAQIVYNFGAAILRAFGDTKRPLYFLSIAGIINVCLNLFFVIVCDLDVAGVALATITSQYISVFLVLRCLMRATDCRHLDLRKLHFDKHEIIRMIQTGLPAGLQSITFSISNVLIQSSINSFGENIMAANTAAVNIESFVYTAMNAVFHAAITFTSQNVGAGKIERTKRIFFCCIATTLMIGLPLCTLCYFFGPQLLGIYVSRSDPFYDTIIAYGMVRITYVLIWDFICGCMDTCCGMVRGLGRSWLPMFVTAAGVCVLRVSWIYTFFANNPTLQTLYLSYPISWIVTVSVHILCFIFTYRSLKRRLEQRRVGIV